MSHRFSLHPFKRKKKRFQNKFLLGRSQSVGPITTNADGSPKRQIRSGSAVPNGTSTSSTKPFKKTPVSTPTIVERRPRPSKYHTA